LKGRSRGRGGARRERQEVKSPASGQAQKLVFRSCKENRVEGAECSDYSGIMESLDIKELHKQCVERLKDLIAEANRTCSLLESMTEFPITLETWQLALSQRVSENNAHDRYQKIRERLFDVIRP
jgi:hypothetical protein